MTATTIVIKPGSKWVNTKTGTGFRACKANARSVLAKSLTSNRVHCLKRRLFGRADGYLPMMIKTPARARA